MASYKTFHCSYGEDDEIALTSRNDMNLAVWEGGGRLRLYNYNYDDSMRERMGRVLHNGITQLWENKTLCDLAVVIGGKVFKCHKIIMASVSGLFKTRLSTEQFQISQQPGQPDTIELDETSIRPEMFEDLLKLIYEGKDFIQEEGAMDLIKAAIYLEMRTLEFRCLDILNKGLAESNCMKMWDWAESNNIPSLASKAKGVALNHFLVLRHTEEFLQMPIERLTMMLGHELLRYRYEDDILEAILDWVTFDTSHRKQHLKELLPFVCFPYLSTRYLNDLRKHELIGLRTEFASYVDEALTYHLAALQKDGKRIQMEVLKRQAHTLKRLMPGMRRVVVLVGGCVIREEPLTSVVACYLDMGHPQSRYREILQFSIASLPQPLGLQSSSSTWKHDVYVSGGSRASSTLLVYKPHENAWHTLSAMPQGRQNHAMVSHDARLYLLGGNTDSKGGHKLVSEVDEYNIETQTWGKAGELVVAVEAAPAVEMFDKIYLFGGRSASGKAVNVVQCLDLSTGQSSIVGELPENVEGAKAILLGKDIILACPNGNIYKIHEDSGATGQFTSMDTETLSSVVFSHFSAEDEDFLEGSDGKRQKHFGLGEDWTAVVLEDDVDVPSQKKTMTSHDEAASDEIALKDSSQQDCKAADPEEECISKVSPEVKTLDEREKDLPNEGQSSDEEKGEEEAGFEKAEMESKETDDESVAEGKDMGPEAEGKADAEDCSTTSQTDFEIGRDEHTGGKKDPTYPELKKLPSQDAAHKIIIKKIAEMEKRSDFGLFIRKADVMVVGGQADNGNFCDDLLRIHVPTGQVCKSDGKLVIPISGMLVETTTLHQNYLLQFFDAASCFFGE